MLLQRYSNIEYVLKLPIKQAIKLILYAKKQNDKDFLLKHYLMIYPNMDKKTYKPFEQYYEEIMPRKIDYDERPIDEIMNEILGRKE